MIDVYLRHRDEGSGEYFGEFPIEELSRLIDSIKDYGIYFVEEKEVYTHAKGQYVNDGTPIYFEVIVW